MLFIFYEKSTTQELAGIMAKAINISGAEPFVVDDCDSINLYKRFLTWKEELDIYLVAAGVTDKNQSYFITFRG